MDLLRCIGVLYTYGDAVSLAVDVEAAVLQASLLGRAGSIGAAGGGLGRDGDGSAESESSSETHFRLVLRLK